jgi:hypothetical protein
MADMDFGMQDMAPNSNDVITVTDKDKEAKE